MFRDVDFYVSKFLQFSLLDTPVNYWINQAFYSQFKESGECQKVSRLRTILQISLLIICPEKLHFGWFGLD